MRTAILVDVDFFLRRFNNIQAGRHGFVRLTDTQEIQDDAKRKARQLWNYCVSHLPPSRDEETLYRIIVYDSPPLDRKLHNPIDDSDVDLSKSYQYYFRTALHKELVRHRSVALRLGSLSKNGQWTLKSERKLKRLLKGTLASGDLNPSDVRYHAGQKGVDMKIGLDIASLTLKRLVQRIILISGDADFVPAAKLARREGLDFVLDPMGHGISDELSEHVDGITTQINRVEGRSEGQGDYEEQQ